MTGFGLRAAGVRSDLRRDPGYSVYPALDFDVVVGSVGDNYDRFLVCVEEIAQSLRIELGFLGRSRRHADDVDLEVDDLVGDIPAAVEVDYPAASGCER